MKHGDMLFRDEDPDMLIKNEDTNNGHSKDK